MADSFNDLVEGIKLELEADFQNLVANSGGSRTDLISLVSFRFQALRTYQVEAYPSLCH